MSTDRVDNSASFFSTTGVQVHRTGAATTDHQDVQRTVQLQAIRVLAKYDALDLLDCLFAPLSPTRTDSDGKRRYGA